jgi:hypothetical protein
LQEIPERQLFKTVFSYCILIIVAPVFTFFAVKIFLFETILNTDSVASNVSSAIAAVVVLHIALGLFIYRAYSDATTAKPAKQD